MEYKTKNESNPMTIDQINSMIGMAYKVIFKIK